MWHDKYIKCDLPEGCPRIHRKVYIYFLVEHFGDNVVRYVGKSIDPQDRYSKYASLSGLRQESHLPVHRWILKNRASGNHPIMRVVECVPETDWESRERYWISHFREEGYRLLNLQGGGGGQSGFMRPSGTKAKIATALKGHEVTEDTRRKISETLQGRTASNAAREAVGRASKASWGRLTPEEHEQRHARMLAGRKPWTPEMKAALAEKKQINAERLARLQGRTLGVRFDKKLKKWIATGKVLNGPRKHLGCWNTEKEAIDAVKMFNASLEGA